MVNLEALSVLAELSRGQWGLVTAAQAAERGVPRPVLARLAGQGRLERLVHGVYRDAGAPGDERDALRAAWLAVRPAVTAHQRLAEGADGAVVCGAAAAWLHGLGSLQPEPYEFCSPQRLQTRRPDVRFHRRRMTAGSVTIVDGLPVTTVAQTVADLLAWRTDESLVAAVVADAAAAGKLEPGEAADRLAPLAARHGLPSGDGAGLLDRLLRAAGADPVSVAERTARGPLGALVAAAYTAELARRLRATAADEPAAPRPGTLGDARQARREALQLAPLLAAAERVLAEARPRPATAGGHP